MSGPVTITDDKIITDQTPAGMRVGLAVLRCPFCGRGPWRKVACHTSHAHGVTAYQLRELVGLTWAVPLCDPALSALHRDQLRARGLRPGQSAKAGRAPRLRATTAGKWASLLALAVGRAQQQQERAA